jgi:hypothetical protein
MHFLLSHGTIGVRKLLKELTRPSVGCPTHRPRRRPLGKGDEFRYGSDLHFLHHPVAVGFDSTFGCTQRVREVLVGLAANDEFEDLANHPLYWSCPLSE